MARPSSRRRGSGRQGGPSKHTQPARPLGAGHATSAAKQDGRWLVRSIPGASAVKSYRCPGCDQVVAVGVPHVVVWPAEPSWSSPSGLDERRHWHTACWQRRP